MADQREVRDGTRTRIVEVAAALLHESGPTAVTTRGVAEAAGVQAPTIYRLFGDKDGLLDAVAEHVMGSYASAKAASAAAAGDVDALDDLAAAWQRQIEFGLANPSIFRLLSDPVRTVDSPAARVGRGVLQARVRRVAETGRLRVSERRAADIIQAAGTGTISMLLSTPEEDRDPGLSDSMYAAVLAQILTDAPGPAGSRTPIAGAVTLRALVPRLDALSEAERRLLAEWLDRVIAASERP